MLFQLITRPTRVKAHSATPIDNIFTNNTNSSVSPTQWVFVTDITDHYPIFLISHESTSEIADGIIFERLYNSMNMREFSETLAHTHWSVMYTASGTQEAFDLFHNKLVELHNKHFPRVRIKKGYSNRKLWLSEALHNLWKGRTKCIMLSRKCHLWEMRLVIKKYKNKLIHIFLKAENNIIMTFWRNTRVAWENHGVSLNTLFVSVKKRKSLRQSKFQLPDAEMTSDKKIISDKFKDFLLILVQHWLNNLLVDKSLLSYLHSRVNEPIFLTPDTTFELEKMLLNLKNSATGLEEINAMFLKTTQNYTRDPLCHICDMSLEEGIFPS